jgi:hypothetical protein
VTSGGNKAEDIKEDVDEITEVELGRAGRRAWYSRGKKKEEEVNRIC